MRGRLAVIILMAVSTIGCDTPVALTQQVEGRRLAADLRVSFAAAADAANRAVLTDSDETAAADVRDAHAATQRVRQLVDELREILVATRYDEEVKLLDTFATTFTQYRRLDDELLPLTTENTNIKAQRLTFGPVAESIAAFRRAVTSAIASAPASDRPEAELLAARAAMALLDIRVLEPRHIAESDDAVMTVIERDMAGHERTARAMLARLQMLVSGPDVTAASASFDRFVMLNREVIALSRRNTDVRSLALTLGRKRTLVAQGTEQLDALQTALAGRRLAATR